MGTELLQGAGNPSFERARAGGALEVARGTQESRLSLGNGLGWA